MDQELTPTERHMFYMPLMHAEDRVMQDCCVALLEDLAKTTPAGPVQSALLSGVDFANQHCDIIAKFNRYPHRNTILGREAPQKNSPSSRQKARHFKTITTLLIAPHLRGMHCYSMRPMISFGHLLSLSSRGILK